MSRRTAAWLRSDEHHREEGCQEREGNHAVEAFLREPREFAWSMAQELVEDDQVEGEPHYIDRALDGSVGEDKGEDELPGQVGAEGDQRHPVGVVEKPAADYQEIGDRPQDARAYQQDVKH